jgi:hypothetical protein
VAGPVIVVRIDDGAARTFKEYGGDDKGWAWIVRWLNKLDGTEIEHNCALLPIRPPAHRLVHSPYVVYGQLQIANRELWKLGLIDGKFRVEHIVHREYERRFFDEKLKAVPLSDQTLDDD